MQLDAREDFRFRSSGTALTGSGSVIAANADRDFYAVLGLDANVFDVAGHYMGVVDMNLWAGKPSSELSSGVPSPLASVRGDRNAYLQAWQLYGQYRPGGGALKLVRVGRQVASKGKPVVFDGVYALAEPMEKLDLFILGGRGEHFFKTTGGLLDTWLGAAGATVRPTETLALEAEYRPTYEKMLTRDAGTESVFEHGYGLSARYVHDEAWRAKLYARGVDAHLAELGALGDLWLDAYNVGGLVRVGVQPQTLPQLSDSEDPYTYILGSSLPYARVQAEAWKIVPTPVLDVELRLGYQGRRLLHDDPAPFNRNIGRAYLTLGLNKLSFVPGLSVYSSLERLGATMDLNNEGTWTGGGGAAYERGVVRADAGVSFQRYRYVYLQDVQEQTDVWVYYADVRVKVLDSIGARVRYSLDFFDRTIHTVTVGLSQSY